MSSHIESAGGVIDLLKSVAYLRELPTQTTSTPFLELEYGKLILFLKKWHEENRGSDEFIKFQAEHKQYIEKSIEVETRNFNEYYEEMFYSIIAKKYPDYLDRPLLERNQILHDLLLENQSA